MILTVKVAFEAAHRLHNPDRDDEWNRRTYGKCNRGHGHGHNYVLEISVRGPVDAETGYVVDMGELKAIVRRSVIDEVDHRHLNLDVPWLVDVNPTAENLATAFAARVAPELPDGVHLDRLTVHETDRNSATWTATATEP